MSKKNLLSGKDKALAELVERYETARDRHTSIYMDAEDLADIAEWYERNNKFDDASEVIDYGLELHPGNTSLLVERCYLHLDMSDLENAKLTAAEITEERTDVTILRARLLVEEERIEDAELQLDTLEDKYSKENIIDVAYMYLETCQYNLAEEWLSHWRWDKDDLEYCCIMADSLMDRGKFTEALAYYNKLIDEDPYHPQYWMGVARCHLGLMEFGKAIDACDYALLANDELGEAYVTKGYCFLELGNSKEAIRCYEQAAKCHNFSPIYMNVMAGQIMMNNQEWEKASRLFEWALQQEGEQESPIIRSSAYSGMAICLQELGKESYEGQALDYCLKAIRLDRLNADAYLLGGLLYAQRGEKDKAIETWEEIGNCDNTSPVWMNIAIHSCRANLFDYAIRALEHIEEMEPDYPDLYRRLTITYLMTGDLEKARQYNRLTSPPFKEKEMNDIYGVISKNPDGPTAQEIRNYLTGTIQQSE